MAKKIKIDDLSKEIGKILETYTDEVISDTKKVVDEVSKDALKYTKDHAPVEDRRTSRRGKYKKSLKIKTVYESLTEKRNKIYASGKEYRLTHLLENGHASRKGGRVKAQPHFSYGQMIVDKQLLKKIKNLIKGDR